MRGLWAIIYKETLQMRRDPSTRFVFLVPAIQTIIFGYAIDLDIQHIKTVVCDYEQSQESRSVSNARHRRSPPKLVQFRRHDGRLAHHWLRKGRPETRRRSK